MQRALFNQAESNSSLQPEIQVSRFRFGHNNRSRSQKKVWGVLLASLGTIAAGLGGAIALSPVAQAEPTTTQVMKNRGAIQAELSYEQVDGQPETGSLDQVRNLQLTIRREGAVLFQGTPVNPVASQGFGSNPDRPAFTNLHPALDAFQVQDLDGDGEPEVWLDLNTSSVGCCRRTHVYRYQPAQKAYVGQERDWGPAGYYQWDSDEDGIPEFYSGDNRFSHAFGWPAANLEARLQSHNFPTTVLPLTVWQYRQGKWVDVTPKYLQKVGSHAYVLWSAYWARHDGGDSTVQSDPRMKAVWAAYLANKLRLGQGEEAWMLVRQAYQGRDRKTYFQRLQQLLARNGYGP